MKTVKLIVFGMMLILAGSVQGQLSVRVNVGVPPAWGPAGYDNARYYYLPDIECYYDIPNSMFIYFAGNRWVHSRFLPSRYRTYDLNHGYKVVMNDYRGNRPYDHFREHRIQYARGYRGPAQRNIGERHDERRHEANPGNRINRPGYDRSHDNGRGHDQGPDNGRGHDNDRREGHHD